MGLILDRVPVFQEHPYLFAAVFSAVVLILAVKGRPILMLGAGLTGIFYLLAAIVDQQPHTEG